MTIVTVVTGPRLSTFKAELGAVLTIIPLGETKAPRRRELIATGRSSTPIETDPGRYLFQVDLPSGETMAEEVNVAEDVPITLELFSKQSPHEWLSWYQTNSDLEQVIRQQSIQDPSIFKPHFEPLLGSGIDLPDLQVRSIDISYDGKGSGFRQYHSVVDFVSSAAIPDDALGVELDQQVVNQDGDFALLDWFSRAGGRIDIPRDTANGQRFYGVVSHAAGLRELITLPFPWNRYDQLCTVELLVPRNAGPEGARAQLTVLDGELGAMLTFLSRDRSSLARAFVDRELMSKFDNVAEDMVDQAVDTLFKKRTNPLASAGAGFVLMQTVSHLGPDEKWYRWIENLYNWFPWLPDGAVLSALLRMARRTTNDGTGAVIARIDEAMARGVPFYQLGLKRLYELVSTFAESTEEADDVKMRMRKYLDLLAPLMRAANPTEPFVSIRSLTHRSRG